MKIQILILWIISSTLLLSNDYSDAEKAYKNKEYTKAIPIFKELCNKNNLKACRKVGEAYQYGYLSYGIKDMGKAAIYYKKAVSILKDSCVENKDKEACSKLGDMYGSGYVAEKNLSKAKKYNKIACDLGDAKACYRISASTKSKNESIKYEQKAINIYKSLCKEGDAEYCKKLGDLYSQSDDFSEAFKFYRESCIAGLEDGCSTLEDLYGKTTSSFGFLDNYQRMCKSGTEGTCKKYKHIKKAQEDSIHIQILNTFKELCNPNNQAACAKLAKIGTHLRTEGNDDGAKALYKIACENKHEPGCDSLKNFDKVTKMLAETKRNYTPNKIREYCEKIVGDSYLLLETCIEQETSAKRRLGY